MSESVVTRERGSGGPHTSRSTVPISATRSRTRCLPSCARASPRPKPIPPCGPSSWRARATRRSAPVATSGRWVRTETSSRPPRPRRPGRCPPQPVGAGQADRSAGAGLCPCRRVRAGRSSPAVRPRRVAGPAAAVEQLAGRSLADGGDRAVGQQDQAEVVDGEDRVWEQFADRAGVPGVRVDHHHLRAVEELGAALLEPAAHRGGGPPVDLPEQPLTTGEVDKPGLPQIAAHPTAVRSGNPAGSPKRVSSKPNAGVGPGSPTSARACAITAHCTVGQDTPNVAATSA
jgi:hypothetical protein